MPLNRIAPTNLTDVAILTLLRRNVLAGAMRELLTDAEVADRLQRLPGWSAAGGPDAAITTTLKFDDFKAALGFVNRVGDEAERLDHHPDIDIRWNQVTFTLSTHSAGGLTNLDFELAQRISSLAASSA
jgi:4a-hydroxytetrahydrobiopterin dehydratase